MGKDESSKEEVEEGWKGIMVRSIGELVVVVMERELKCGFMMVKRRSREEKKKKKKKKKGELKQKSVTMAEGFGFCRKIDGYWFFVSQRHGGSFFFY